MNDQIETELPFVATKEYRRFAEFCDACRRYRYIGLCYGVPGVGKTRSAREYARWDRITPLLPEELFTLAGRSYFDGNFPHKPFASVVAPSEASVLPCRTVFSTPPVSSSVGRIEREVMGLCASLSYLVEAAEQASRGTDDFLLAYRVPERTELVIVDEANRLKEAGLEQLYVIYNLERSGRLLNNIHYVYSELVSDVLFQRSRARVYIMRDLYDRGHFGMVLIGMPGLEKRLAHYPQLYSRVGFVHQFRVLNERWSHLDITGQPEDWTFQEAVNTIVRITAGNVRLIHRLLIQVERILQINELHTVTKEVVETARENLVIGLA